MVIGDVMLIFYPRKRGIFNFDDPEKRRSA